MNNILLLGAGRSSSSLIKYLLEHAAEQDWKLHVADVSVESAKNIIGNHPAGRAFQFDVTNETQRKYEINQADIIISLLPAALHILVAKECIALKKNMVTASYVSPEIKALEKEAEEAGIILMNEIGLDPGIDHLSAMQVIDTIKAKGGRITSFKSYCGGLVAPAYNNNPWGYKITWNPRNVVMAGQGTAQYIENGCYKYVPYNRIFAQVETINVSGHGKFEAYANRDSLSYREPYGLIDVETILRGTFRMPGYCEAWNVLVKLGLTDDSYKVMDAETLTYKDFIMAYLPANAPRNSLKEKLAAFCNITMDGSIMQKIEWLGLLDETPIGISNVTPAQLLQHVLEQKWKLEADDKDMIVMQHQFEYELNGKIKKLESSMVVVGDDQTYTAMAKTVGLPVGIVTKLILEGKIKMTGVVIPVYKSIYEPVLTELEAYGVHFHEQELE